MALLMPYVSVGIKETKKKKKISLVRLHVTGRRRHVRPYTIYIFLMSEMRTIDLAMSVRLSVRLSVMSRQRFSDTIRATDKIRATDMQSMCGQNSY